ncbi:MULTISPECIES: hypothetical protein [unclassified Pseudomonas]|uniref:hypothetical protein n=1 Tax=unclassified Pseudomonas TaxID=196821 RepID=UPI0024471ED9|nr:MULTISPECIES: hypothetical protein [unclassified Pseudomonas]MDG9924999.1 hypothetical protein [Pseudomonas sp. GD04045]MDH0036280.1 hypothetical protein [Pseudomonas sp. GD04019]
MSDRHAISPYPLRMPPELRAALERASVVAGRSLHAEILAKLEAALQADRNAATAELVDAVSMQASLTLALARELEGIGLGADQRQALDSLVKFSRRLLDRLGE